MADVFEAEPDGRQSADMSFQPSIFRPVYRALSDEEKTLHDQIKVKAGELEQLIYQTNPPHRRDAQRPTTTNRDIYEGRAMEALELAVMWAVKGLTS